MTNQEEANTRSRVNGKGLPAAGGASLAGDLGTTAQETSESGEAALGLGLRGVKEKGRDQCARSAKEQRELLWHGGRRGRERREAVPGPAPPPELS